MFCKMEMMQDLCALQILSTLLSLVTQSLKSDSILKLFIITLILFDFGVLSPIHGWGVVDNLLVTCSMLRGFQQVFLFTSPLKLATMKHHDP